MTTFIYLRRQIIKQIE